MDDTKYDLWPLDAVGEMLRTARQDAGYATIYQLVRASALSSSMLQAAESDAGPKGPTVGTLLAIGKALDVEFVIGFRPRRGGR